MASTFDPKAFTALHNAMVQIETLAAAVPNLRLAAEAAKAVLVSVGNAEEARDKAVAELAEAQSDLDGLNGERDRVRAELADLAAKKQAALQKAIDAFAELK